MTGRRYLTTILIILLLLPFSLCALMTHVGASHTAENQPIGMTVYGFIEGDEPIFRIEPSAPEYGGEGINLDVMDPANELRYQIAPSAQAMSIAGAKIGSFSVVSSLSNRTIIITHTPLILIRDTSVEVDWELAVSWNLNGEHRTSFCLSTFGNTSSEGREITINLNGTGNDVVRIHDALLHFRLSNTDAVTESGSYHAFVKFWVEGI